MEKGEHFCNDCVYFIRIVLAVVSHEYHLDQTRLGHTVESDCDGRLPGDLGNIHRSHVSRDVLDQPSIASRVWFADAPLLPARDWRLDARRPRICAGHRL